MKKIQIPNALQKAHDHADSLPDDWFGDEKMEPELETEYQESKMKDSCFRDILEYQKGAQFFKSYNNSLEYKHTIAEHFYYEGIKHNLKKVEELSDKPKCDNCGETEMPGGMSWMGLPRYKLWCGRCDASQEPKENPKRVTFEEVVEKVFGVADTLKCSDETINKICNGFYVANEPYIDHLEDENGRLKEHIRVVEMVNKGLEAENKELKERYGDFKDSNDIFPIE